MDYKTYDKAREFARYNRRALRRDSLCGCYFCLRIYNPKEIVEWCAEKCRGRGVTAVCPHCGVDAVISESVGYPLTEEFLRGMHEIAWGSVSLAKQKNRC